MALDSTTDNDDNNSDGDKQTLAEYIASLSAEDKELVTPDLPLDIEQLRLMDNDEFANLINKARPDLDQQQQNRRIEIIKRISDLQADEKVLEGVISTSIIANLIMAVEMVMAMEKQRQRQNQKQNKKKRNQRNIMFIKTILLRPFYLLDIDHYFYRS